MTWLRAVSTGLVVLGLAGLAFSLALLGAAQALPADGFRDLARIAGAMLVAALAGIPASAALLLDWKGKLPVQRWKIFAAAVVAVVSLASALWIGMVAMEGANVALLAGVAALAAADAAALAVAPGLLRRRGRA